MYITNGAKLQNDLGLGRSLVREIDAFDRQLDGVASEINAVVVTAAGVETDLRWVEYVVGKEITYV